MMKTSAGSDWPTSAPRCLPHLIAWAWVALHFRITSALSTFPTYVIFKIR